MNIKSKIVGISIVYLIGTLFSLLIYSYFTRNIKSIESEQQLFNSVQNLLQQERVFISDYNYRVLDQHLKKHNEYLEKKITISSFIDDMVQLPKQGKSIKNALENIKKLDVMLESRRKIYIRARDQFLLEVGKISNSTKITMVDLYQMQSLYSHKRYGIFVNRRVAYTSESTILLNTIDANLNQLKKQSKIINFEIFKLKNKAIKNTIIFIVPIILAAFILSFNMAKSTTKSIYEIIKNISLLAEGDLTNNVVIKSTDELGFLSKQMFIFQNSLKDSLNSIKGHSSSNQKIKIFLLDTVFDTSSASAEISQNISSVNKQVATLNNNIYGSNNMISQISDFSSVLNIKILDQLSMVEESTASINQMIASISSVASLTDKNHLIMNNLKNIAKEGDEQINETTDLIDDINSSMEKIGEMAEVINNISDQTNLLAMNAAIEAAHAGDAGKGFAVVADEIRKLSEASTLSSKDISKNLQDIVRKFKLASDSGINTKTAFKNIYENIKMVSDSLTSVTSSTSELNIGGQQILEAMENLNHLSQDVKIKSTGMQDSADTIKVRFNDISNISEVVTTAMAEVDSGFSEISDSISGLEIISNQIGEVSLKLNIEVNKFKTEDIEVM